MGNPFRRTPRFASVPGNPNLKRFLGFSGLGSAAADFRPGIPMPDGSEGSPVGPYDESGEVWGTMPGEVGAQAQVAAPPADPSQLPVNAPSPTSDNSTIQMPFGVTFAKWRNPNTFQSVPITLNTPSNVPVLSLNLLRSGLVIQNNSTATTAGDVAPTFYVGFNAQAQAGLALAILPGGGGILFDLICPRDSIYITIGASTNTGGSVVVQGSIVQGTYAPI